MIDKSVLRKVVDEVLDDHEVSDGDITDDVIERLGLEIEIFDDETEEEEDEDPAF